MENSKARKMEDIKEQAIFLVRRAMGKRSMRQFSSDAEVNVSTISRILSGKVTKIRESVIKKIVDAADPDSGITAKDFKDLYSPMLVDWFEMEPHVDPNIQLAFKRKVRAEYVNDVQMAISYKLLKGNYTVRFEANDGPEKNDTISRPTADFTLWTNAIGSTDTEWEWVFLCKMNETSYFHGPGSYERDWVNSVMAYYFMGGKAGRMSLVTDDKQVFYAMKEWYSDIRIPKQISCILISEDARTVIAEWLLPLSEELKSPFTLASEDL